MNLVIDTKNNRAIVKLQLNQIRFNKERKVYYYDKDALKFLQEQGLKPTQCIKSCVVDNVRNTVGEWIFELETKSKPLQIRTAPVTITKDLRGVVIDHVVDVPKEVSKPKRSRRKTKKQKVEE